MAYPSKCFISLRPCHWGWQSGLIGLISLEIKHLPNMMKLSGRNWTADESNLLGWGILTALGVTPVCEFDLWVFKASSSQAIIGAAKTTQPCLGKKHLFFLGYSVAVSLVWKDPRRKHEILYLVCPLRKSTYFLCDLPKKFVLATAEGWKAAHTQTCGREWGDGHEHDPGVELSQASA